MAQDAKEKISHIFCMKLSFFSPSKCSVVMTFCTTNVLCGYAYMTFVRYKYLVVYFFPIYLLFWGLILKTMTIISRLRPALRTSCKIECLPAISLSTNHMYVRCYSAQKGGITKSQERSEVSADVRPLGEKIKETTKTVSYTGVIVLGVGVTGVIFYYVFRELFSGNSANSIYSEALEKCKNVSIWLYNVICV